MKCPHCERDCKAPVSQTVELEGVVYRRRACGLCGKNFTTTETGFAKLVMPRKRPRLYKPVNRLTADTTELSKAWS